MSIITKEDLKKLTQYEPTTITLKDLGEIKIIPLTQKIRNEARIVATDEMGNLDLLKFQSYVVVNCVIEPKLSIEDLSWVENLPSGILDTIIMEIYRISGITTDFEELKKK